MWRILLESIKKGLATRSYPEGVEQPPERFRGMVRLNPELCDRSAACVRVCPTRAISLVDDLENGRTRWEVDHASCIFCGLCESSCPRGAIAIGHTYQLAVRSKDDMRVSVTFSTPDAKEGS